MNTMALKLTLGDFENLIGQLTSATESKATRKALTSDLRSFWEFTKGNLSESHIRNYKNHLTDLEYAPRSVCRLLSSARKLLDILVLDRHLERNILDHVKSPKVDRYDSPYFALSDDEVRKLIESPDRSTLTGAGTRLSLILGFHLGLRVGEICSLRCDQILSMSSGKVIKVKGKGGKTRIIPIDGLVADEIDTYLATSTMLTGDYAPSDVILRTQRRSEGEIHTATVERWYRDTALAIGIDKKFTPHSARATVITKALDNGASIRDVAVFAGHDSIETTSIYDKRRGVASAETVKRIIY
jgi:integrase/recombinase XerD